MQIVVLKFGRGFNDLRLNCITVLWFGRGMRTRLSVRHAVDLFDMLHDCSDGYWTARVCVCVRVEFPWLKRVCQQDPGWITWVQLHVVNSLFLFIPIACVTDLFTGKAAAACRRAEPEKSRQTNI